MIEIKEEIERFILIGVSLGDTYKNGKIQADDTEDSLNELKELVQTAGGETVGILIQNREAVDKATYFGKGKVEELKAMAAELGATGIVSDDELTPAQLDNLENALDLKICDRTQIILEIFARHAFTREGKIQVELAQLKYRQSHLVGLGRSLSRQGGGIGTRGPGEKKLETDRRLIRDRISELNNELDNVVRTRDVTRAQRAKANIPSAAIVGYTNAGKSTLLNKATGASELEADMLFATLDPVVRELDLGTGQKVLMTDTVGFVRKLPHHLVDAFRSTLEEAKYSDIIVHVVDASNPDRETQAEVTYETLDKLGIKGKTFITFFNKCDKPETADETLRDLRADYVIRGSAKTGEGIEELKALLDKIIREKREYIEKVFAFSEAGEIQKIRRNGQIISEEYMEDGIHVKAYVDR
ncbi:MAG: GTPase HflX [Lachnospiraceae bacterium]|nr:GTPase HflX [Lachnospiraceae bacterium]